MNAARGGSPDDPSKAFRERARLEADRYGPDPWIFVRELLQNARDAGADTVRFHVFDREGQSGDAAIICQDNGEGMTFEHARRYLFALYASSKEGKKNQAGKFGVGFWSILRFEPATIIIRSRPREGDPWGISLDGNLDHAMAVEPPTHAGTEIVLRRPRRDGQDAELDHRIHDAVWQSARYLRQRDAAEVPLEIEVNGRPANAEFALEAPSAAFRRGQVRGVVGLGRAPRVELFSRGLRVRSAASLEDLLSGTGRHSSWMRVQFPELPAGLAPQALLESPDLEIMLSRSDARDTRALGKLVRLAQRELERLIERQLEVARPLPWWGRLRQWIGERTRDLSRLRRADAIVLALVVAVVTAVGLRGSGSPPAREVAVRSVVQQVPLPAGTAPVRPRPFQDMGSRYRGPSVGLAAEALEPIGLRYKPPEPNHRFAALTFARLAADGSPVKEVVPRPVGPYASASCGGRLRCIQIDLDLRSTARAVRIPVPTGHRVVAPSLWIRGQQRPRLRASADGRPVVVLAAPASGVLRYRTAAMLDPAPPAAPVPPADLPPALGRRARQLRAQPVARRVETLLDLVRERVAYDDSPTTARRHRESLARGDGFLQRVLSIGAGDCDVQNGLLTALLQAAGVPARLAVGYLGDRGSVLPWVHAWVEYFDDRGRWQVADASENAAGAPQVEQLAARTRPHAARPSRADAAGAKSLPAWDDPAEAFAAADVEAALASPGAAPPAVAAPARPAATAATPPVARVAPPAPRTSPLSSLALSLGLPLLLLAAGWSLVAARTRRAFKLDGGADLSKLLQGVLQQPGAFAHIHALFHRPIVPLVAGNAVSLRRARELASRGRLYCTRERPELARGALRAGAAVLDYGLAEGKIVADALGAVDLDAWAKMIASATSDPLLDEVNRLLREEGEEWSVRASVEAKAGLAALDLVPLGAQVPGVPGTRLVVVQDGADWLGEARRYHESRPQAATFMVLDQLALRLNLPRVRRGELLGASARQAILESFAT